MANTSTARSDRRRSSRMSPRRQRWLAAAASAALSAGLLVAGTTPAAAVTEHVPCGPVNALTGKYEGMCVRFNPPYVPPKLERDPILMPHIVTSPIDPERFEKVDMSLNKLMSAYAERPLDRTARVAWETIAVAALTQAGQDLQGVELKIAGAASSPATVGKGEEWISAISLAQAAALTRDTGLRAAMLARASATIQVALEQPVG